MEIGLFPGSFNPIHHGHLIIAQYFLNQFPLDQVWFVISPQNPLKKRSSLVDFNHRMKMVQISIMNSPKMIASDIEQELPVPSFTIHTLDYLKSNLPENNYSLILGLDNYAGFNRWKSHDRIIQENKVYLYPREGHSIPETLSSANFILTHAPEIGISSTMIRNGIQENKSIRFLVTDPVLDYIQKNQLYKN